MIPAGYLYKRVSPRPDWLKAAAVGDVYSLSNCISAAFADYVPYWQHNGYWLFDSPSLMDRIAARAVIDLSGNTLFYYEVFEAEFDQETKQWRPFAPEPAFATAVSVPVERQLAGFDVVSFSAGTLPECSPLSCNALAAGIPVNLHCLFDTLAAAKQALEDGVFGNSEPGPYRIFAVHTLE